MANEREPLSTREMKILVTKSGKDPYYVLTNSDCFNVSFCERFFELCNEVMFDTPDRALEQAFIARRLAKETRDPHLMAKAISMVGAGYRIESLYTRASSCIRQALELAAGCACCLPEIRRREGLNLWYERKFDKCYDVWTNSMLLYEQINNVDGIASVLILRGSALYMLGRYPEALDDERNGLALLSDKAPSRYYIAGIVNVAATLVNYNQYDEALECLRQVRDSIKGQVGKHERVRVILRWIEGLIFAKVGRRRDAFKRLSSARNGIKRLGLYSEYIAISADISRLYKTGTTRTNDDQVIDLATECLEKGRPTDAERQILKKLSMFPELADIDRLRAASTCRVPALLYEADDGPIN